MLPIQGLIFDIDGTLIDSNDAHANAWKQVFDENGLSVEFIKIRSAIGMGGDHLLPLLTGLSADSTEGKKLEQRRGEIFRAEYLPQLKAFPRTREMLELLKAKDYRIAIATSASAKDLHALLKQTNLEGLFDMKTSSSDVSSSKPDPDIVEAALKRAHLDARRALMVGDTPYDIEAAAKAGVKTIAFTSGGWTRDKLAQAWKVYRDPAEFLLAVERSEAFIEPFHQAVKESIVSPV